MTKSRNQREGKFIPGWCYNPAYKVVGKKLEARKRAGGNFNLSAIRNFNDNGYTLPGVTLVRHMRADVLE